MSKPGSRKGIGPKSYKVSSAARRLRDSTPGTSKSRDGEASGEDTVTSLDDGEGSGEEEFGDYSRGYDGAASKQRDGSVHSDVSDCSVVSDDCGEMVYGPESRSRGRPVTTGVWEAKKAKLAKRHREMEEKRIRDSENPMVPAILSKNRREGEYRSMEELRHQPTEDLARRIVEQVAVVDKVNTTSKTSRGGDRGSSNKAASTISAAATHLISRMKTGDEVARDVEIEGLRQETAELKKKVAELQKRSEERQGVPWGEATMMEVDPPSASRAPVQSANQETAPPPLGREKRRKRSNVIRDDDSGDEGETPDTREECLKQISEEGMPAAMRPSSRGKPPVVIDPAVPPIRPRTEEMSLEDRLKTEMRRMETRFEDMIRGSMERIAMPPPGTVPEAARRRGNPTNVGNRTPSKSPASKAPTTPRKNRSGKGGGGPGSRDGSAGKIRPTGSEQAGREAVEGRNKAKTSPTNAQPVQPAQASWSEVVKRGASRKKGQPSSQLRKQQQSRQPPQGQSRQYSQAPNKGRGAPGGTSASANSKSKGATAASGSNKAAGSGNGKAGARKPPRTAAVTSTCLGGEYDQLMREARSRITLKDLGIDGPSRPKRAQTGALLIELPGKEGEEKANKLAEKMSESFRGREGVVVSRPVKTGEFRVLDIEDSVSPDEVAEAVASMGKCPKTQVQVGPFRRGPNGSSTAWVKGPLTAVGAIEKGGNRLQLGWFEARVQQLEARPLQCFRCSEGGHVRATCTSEVDRSARCYRCGAGGHLARDCRERVNCPVCADLKKPAAHRAGSKACTAVRRRSRPGWAVVRTPPPPAQGEDVEMRQVENADGSGETSSMEVERVPLKRTLMMDGEGENEENTAVEEPTNKRKQPMKKMRGKSPVEKGRTGEGKEVEASENGDQ